MNQIQQLPPSELTVHPAAKPMPEWASDDDRFLALVEDIRARGIDQPLQVDAEHRIIDGRHRWRAAKKLKLDQVPVIARGGDQVASVIINSLIQRRHYTKGALAYLAYPLLKSAHEEALQRHLQRLQSGNKGTISSPGRNGQSVEDLARELGISRETFDRAAQVHEIFAKDPEYKALMEPAILREAIGGEHPENRPVGLGAVYTGWKGKLGTKGKPKHDSPTNRQLDLFVQSFDALAGRYDYWTKFDDETKAAVRPAIRASLQKMPHDLLAEYERALKAEIQVRKRKAHDEANGG